MKASVLLASVALVALAGQAAAQTLSGESPRTTAVELKLGGYKPLIDREPALEGGKPYEETFGTSPMLLFEVGVERMLWQRMGTASVGVSLGYAEKYAWATMLDDAGNEVPSSERTGFFVLPIRLMGIYRFDYPALHMRIPLVPYAKAGLVYTPWWATKGSQVQSLDGAQGSGGKWGYGFTAGLSLLLDVLEPRLARDFDNDLGVNHSYLFAEYTYEDVNNFGGSGLDLSSRHWMFGMAFEF